jgi:hypothetical protein
MHPWHVNTPRALTSLLGKEVIALSLKTSLPFFNSIVIETVVSNASVVFKDEPLKWDAL